MNQVKLKFGNTFSGQLETKHSSAKIGQEPEAMLPYEMLAGALGSCLYATFLDVIHKMRLEFEGCDMDIVWEKREEVPTTMKTGHVKAHIYGINVEKAGKYEHAFKLSTEYCSIYHTLSQVATLTYEVTVEAAK